MERLNGRRSNTKWNISFWGEGNVFCCWTHPSTKAWIMRNDESVLLPWLHGACPILRDWTMNSLLSARRWSSSTDGCTVTAVEGEQVKMKRRFTIVFCGADKSPQVTRKWGFYWTANTGRRLDCSLCRIDWTRRTPLLDPCCCCRWCALSYAFFYDVFTSLVGKGLNLLTISLLNFYTEFMFFNHACSLCCLSTTILLSWERGGFVFPDSTSILLRFLPTFDDRFYSAFHLFL